MEEETKKDRNGELGFDGNTMYAVLAYLWILCLVPVFLKKTDAFVRFHVRQGLMLFIVEVGIGIISIVPVFGGIIAVLGILICGILSLTGIVQVLMGNRWKMPVIGEWAEKINV